MLTIRNKKGKKSALFYIVWSAPAVGAVIVTVLLGYITFFATDVLGLKPGLVGILLLASKVFDGFTDIIAGFLIDKTHTKIGKARPYDIAYVFFCLSALLFFFIPEIGTVGKATLLFIIYLLTYSIFQTLYSCANTVYLARAVESGEDQISLTSLSGMITYVAAFALSVAFPSIIDRAGTDQSNWKTIALAICIPATMLCLIRIFFIPEIKNVDTTAKQESLGVKQSAKLLFSNHYLIFFTLALLVTNIAQTLVSNSQTYYFKYVIGDISAMTIVSAVAVVGTLSIAFFPALSRKMGMRNLMAAALMLGVIGKFLPVFKTTSMPLLIIGSLLNGLCYMPIYILSTNAIIDCMDYGEYKSGIRGEGIYTCVSGFCSKVGIGLASGILGIVTALGGYDGTLAIQSVSANRSIIFSYTILPAILYLVAVLALRKFNLEKKLPEIRETLKEKINNQINHRISGGSQMNHTLFPKPKQLETFLGHFIIPASIPVAFPEDLTSLASIVAKFLNHPVTISEEEPMLTFQKDASLGKEAYRLEIQTEHIYVTYAEKSGAFYALVTLSQLIDLYRKEIPCCKIIDEPALAVRGYMLDISRGKVPSLADLCQYIDRLAALKYNQLQLYVEGFSFAYPSYPQVWKDKTPITGEEIRYLDAYCKERCIELVPNQNSLGHMAPWLALEEFHHLAEADHGREFMGSVTAISTLDAMDPKSLDFVTSLMDDMLPFFTSDKFNVNLDEPFELGLGKNKELAEKKGEAYLYMDYLERLQKRVSARGKHMYMWGDILTHHPETYQQLPEDVTVLDWGYEAYTPFDEHAAALSANHIPFILCPGTCVWTILGGRTDTMISNVRNAAKAAIEHQGEGVLLTAWGDGGHLEYTSLNDPAIAYSAACNWGQLDVTEAEAASYLNRYFYKDDASQTAQIIFDLGRLYQHEEFPMINMTIASLNMSMGLLPEGVLPDLLTQAVRSIEAFGPTMDASHINELLENRKEFDYEGAMESLDCLKERMIQIAPSGDDALLLRSELENAIRIAEFAQKVHYLNAAVIADDEKKLLAKEIQKLGTEILEAHPALWIKRNRLHGLKGSVAKIHKILEQLEKIS